MRGLLFFIIYYTVTFPFFYPDAPMKLDQPAVPVALNALSAKNVNIPRATIQRLSVYLQVLEKLQ